ncbi:hypothetical protein PVK06_048852 [Gossypium arboreum]|uniref:RNase H type-1 domain-containing protein n=1 Tax=Gossypium arboreum TaxID=29729 RepID=A0ABR0MHI9_GOSAR|nr:hypothetical protein PVK06_048852 [Gossypium arboreum]
MHAILKYGPANEVWSQLGLHWVTDPYCDTFWYWIAYVFQTNDAIGCSKILTTMWLLWHARNQYVMEGLVMGSGSILNSNVADAFSAEALACLQALTFAKEMGWATLISSLKIYLMKLLKWFTKIDGHYSFLKGLDSTIACDLLTGRRSKFWVWMISIWKRRWKVSFC